VGAEIGVLLYGRLLAGGRDRARRHELVEQLLNRDAVTRRVARDEVVDRGLLDEDGQVAVLLIRHSARTTACRTSRPAPRRPGLPTDAEELPRSPRRRAG